LNPFTVLWHPEAEKERDASWPPSEKAAMFNAVAKLEASGPTLGNPHSSAVKGDVANGLRELRPRAGRSRWRPIYRQMNATTFVIFAVVPEAQIDSRGFRAGVTRAWKRFENFDDD
jgi:hypothetical protein